tara:strand:- start:660 stop:833 length:174 start_codon:yes stop_codon:yes gene_type:complete
MPKLISTILLMITATLFIAACEQESDVEKIGDSLDDAVENVDEAANDAKRAVEDAAD